MIVGWVLTERLPRQADTSVGFGAIQGTYDRAWRRAIPDMVKLR